jgi:hypothetical protein
LKLLIDVGGLVRETRWRLREEMLLAHPLVVELVLVVVAAIANM